MKRKALSFILALALSISCLIGIINVSAAAASATPDKAVYTINEKMVITVAGVPEEQLDYGAFVAVYKKDDRAENFLDWQYVAELINGKWEVNAPSAVGDYEIRVYVDDSYEAASRLVSSPLKVAYIVDRTATVKTDKSAYTPNEEITITVDGVTETQKQSSAFVAVYKKDDRHENYMQWEYVISMINGKWEVNAPSTVGDYEMRLYAADSYTDDALLISVPFTVSGAPVEYISEGYNGISGWAVEEVTEAKKDNLTTDKVMVEFQKAITREEFCELAIKLYEAMTGKIAEPAATGTFSDTINSEILKAFNLGIVKGIGNGQFAPDNSVTRQEIATMLLNVVRVALPTLDTTVANPPSFIDGYDIDSWALEGVNYFATKEIIKGAEGAFLPKANCTCEAAIALVKRVFDTFASI